MLTLIGMKKYPILILILLASATACKKPEDALEKPEIAFISMSPSVVASGNLKDTVLISLRYSIASSGIGLGPTPTEIYFKDSRDSNSLNRLPFPDEVSAELPETENNIRGNISVKIPASLYLVLRPERPDGDTVRYQMYLRDKNGLESNKITTPDIYIMP